MMHIKGRKYKQLNRATLRDKKLTDKRARSLDHKEKGLAIYYFLQETIRDDPEFSVREEFTLSEMQDFIAAFLTLDDDELEELKAAVRPGRPITSRQKHLQAKVQHEQHLFDTGIKIPDLRDKPTVTFLRAWNGTTGGATILQTVIVDRNMADEAVAETIETESS